MSTIITSDLHLSDNPRDEYRLGFMHHLADAAAHFDGVKRILILGDLTEAKDRHGAWLVNDIVGGIYDIACSRPVYILRGNHDYRAEETPFFQFLNYLENVHWIEHPSLLNLDGLGRCMFLPHTHDPERDWPEFDKNIDWFFCHNTFEGAESEHGKRLSGISASRYFPKRARIISGDIHTPQKVGGVTYVGAPYTVDFGDDYEGRTLLISDGEKIPMSILYEGPQKRLLDIESLDELEGLEAYHADDILKVRITLDASQTDQRRTVKAAIRKWGDRRGYHIDSVQVRIDAPEKTSVKQKHRTAEDDATLVRRHAKRHKANPRMLKAGLRLMDSA